MYHQLLCCLLTGYIGALLGALVVSLLTMAERSSYREQPHPLE
jgi:hypothetical protein